ncbi:MAG: tetratricopeptide repeat protein [Verrucomicrobia bacterium]|nr:tetratricopeptide repeat protein [Verrucomicrobiota bacterium]
MSDSTRQTSGSSWKEILLIILVSAAAYAPGFWNGFVYDDELYVLGNPLAQGSLHIRRIFTETYPPGEKDRGLYRPLVVLSFFIDGKIWGFPASGQWNGFHLTNTVFHALNAGLFLILLQRLGLGTWTRLVSAGVFGLHPALSEAAAWISGRAELMGMSFGLMALLVFLRRPRNAHLAVAMALWLLAMLCKEHWIVLPALAVLVCVCMPGDSKLKRREAIGGACLAAVVATLFWILRFQAVGSWHPPMAAYGSVAAFSRTATSLGVLWHYVGLWLWPVGLSVHHEIRIVSNPVHGAAILTAWLAVFWLAWRTRRLFPWLSLAVGWFWIAILPVSNLIVTIGAVSGERFLYLPTLLFAPVMVMGANLVFSGVFRDSLRRTLLIAMGVVWCLLLVVRLWLRLDDWSSNLALWESAARQYPQSYGIKAQLAVTLLREKRFGEAHVLAAEALAQGEKNPQPYQKHFTPRLMETDAKAQTCMREMVWVNRFNAANETARSQHLQEALTEYRSLAAEFPEHPQTWEALGDLYVRLNNHVAARQNFEEAIRLNPKSAALFGKHGQTLSALGKKAEALLAYDRALEINCMDPLTHYNRGVVLAELGEYDDALGAFNAASRLAPVLMEPHLNAANILIHLKRYDEAIKELAHVLKVDPRKSEAIELLKKIPGVEHVVSPVQKPSIRERRP